MSEIWLDCPLNTSIRWLKDQKVERLHWRTFFLNSIRVRTSQYLIENTIICEAKIWCFFFSNLHILTWIAWFLASEGLLDAFHNVCACRNYFILGNRKIWGCQFSYITENHIWHIIICIKQYLDMAAIQEYCTRICFLSRNGVVQERKELFRNINDDAFFPYQILACGYQDDFLEETKNRQETRELSNWRCLLRGMAVRQT